MAGKPVELTIRAWPDDPAWADRVGGLVGRALPVLAERIGLAWPRDDGLIVEEAASRSTGGYAGLFDPREGLVEVAYYADDSVVLHEAAHAWFNGSLLADRWANEAFASYYGLAAAEQLGVAGQADELTPELIDARIPLNAWGPIGRQATDTEDYAYAASLVLAREIADRAGPAMLQAVWAAAAARVGGYQPPTGNAPETVDGPPDWRGLLDLLEAPGTDSYDELWREWVVRDSDLKLLDARLAARSAYDDVVGSAGDWSLPQPIREALRAWQFETAGALLADAGAILGQRGEIESAAAASGLVPPPALQVAFELPDGFNAARLEATEELSAIARFDGAVATRPAEPDLLELLGMLGTTPEADLTHARALFAAGDLAGSRAAAGAAAAVWTSAADVGRGRLVSIVALTLAALLALALLIGGLRGRRRRRHGSAGGSDAPEPYATLAATHDLPPPAVVGDEGRRGANQD